MIQYYLDTSAWMDGWIRDYPPDVFPSIWELIDEEIEKGVIKASEEVYVEIEKKMTDSTAGLKIEKRF